MTDPRIKNLANLLVNYSVKVQSGDTVMLIGTPVTLPLLRETYRHILQAGGHPDVVWYEPEFWDILLKEGNEEQLRFVSPALNLMTDEYDCYIRLAGMDNTRSLSKIPMSQQKIRREALRPMLEKRLKRAADGDHRWVGTLYPTKAYAQEADMSLPDFEDFVYGACFADKADPVAEWQKISREQQKLVDWLAGKKHIKVKGPNAELTLSIAGRTFINSDGTRNMPSGEIFTGPVEDSVNGWVRFTYPAIVNAQEVDGIELRFEDGKVVAATAAKNEAFLHSMLDTDAGARYLGEFAIGTNRGIQQFTKSILFDEKIAGTIHMAVGTGYPETGSKNRSAIHWDMICDMRDGGQIWVDDELFYVSGKFLI